MSDPFTNILDTLRTPRLPLEKARRLDASLGSLTELPEFWPGVERCFRALLDLCAQDRTIQKTLALSHYMRPLFVDHLSQHRVRNLTAPKGLDEAAFRFAIQASYDATAKDWHNARAQILETGVTPWYPDPSRSWPALELAERRWFQLRRSEDGAGTGHPEGATFVRLWNKYNGPYKTPTTIGEVHMDALMRVHLAKDQGIELDPDIVHYSMVQWLLDQPRFKGFDPRFKGWDPSPPVSDHDRVVWQIYRQLRDYYGKDLAPRLLQHVGKAVATKEWVEVLLLCHRRGQVDRETLEKALLTTAFDGQPLLRGDDFAYWSNTTANQVMSIAGVIVKVCGFVTEPEPLKGLWDQTLQHVRKSYPEAKWIRKFDRGLERHLVDNDGNTLVSVRGVPPRDNQDCESRFYQDDLYRALCLASKGGTFQPVIDWYGQYGQTPSLNNLEPRCSEDDLWDRYMWGLRHHGFDAITQMDGEVRTVRHPQTYKWAAVFPETWTTLDDAYKAADATAKLWSGDALKTPPLFNPMTMGIRVGAPTPETNPEPTTTVTLKPQVTKAPVSTPKDIIDRLDRGEPAETVTYELDGYPHEYQWGVLYRLLRTREDDNPVSTANPYSFLLNNSRRFRLQDLGALLALGKTDTPLFLWRTVVDLTTGKDPEFWLDPDEKVKVFSRLRDCLSRYDDKQADLATTMALHHGVELESGDRRFTRPLVDLTHSATVVNDLFRELAKPSHARDNVRRLTHNIGGKDIRVDPTWCRDTKEWQFKVTYGNGQPLYTTIPGDCDLWSMVDTKRLAMAFQDQQIGSTVTICGKDYKLSAWTERELPTDLRREEIKTARKELSLEAGFAKEGVVFDQDMIMGAVSKTNAIMRRAHVKVPRVRTTTPPKELPQGDTTRTRRELCGYLELATDCEGAYSPTLLRDVINHLWFLAIAHGPWTGFSKFDHLMEGCKSDCGKRSVVQWYAEKRKPPTEKTEFKITDWKALDFTSTQSYHWIVGLMDGNEPLDRINEDHLTPWYEPVTLAGSVYDAFNNTYGPVAWAHTGPDKTTISLLDGIREVDGILEPLCAGYERKVAAYAHPFVDLYLSRDPAFPVFGEGSLLTCHRNGEVSFTLGNVQTRVTHEKLVDIGHAIEAMRTLGLHPTMDAIEAYLELGKLSWPVVKSELGTRIAHYYDRKGGHEPDDSRRFLFLRAIGTKDREIIRGAMEYLQRNNRDVGTYLRDHVIGNTDMPTSDDRYKESATLVDMFRAIAPLVCDIDSWLAMTDADDNSDTDEDTKAGPTALDIAMDTFKGDVKAIALRTGVSAVSAATIDLLSRFLEQRGATGVAEFLATEEGKGTAGIFTGASWLAIRGMVTDPMVRDFGDMVAKELRVSGGSNLLGSAITGALTTEKVRLIPAPTTAGGNGGVDHEKPHDRTEPEEHPTHSSPTGHHRET